MILAPLGDLDAFVATRDALHAVAEHVLAAYRFRAEGHIGLIVTDDGFGTPEFGDHESARIVGCELVVERNGSGRRSPLTTLAAAGAACGIEPGAPPVYPPATPLTLDAPLPLDDVAATHFEAWFAFGWTRLVELGGSETTPTLWPEHFDAAVELGDEQRGTRGTYGASPGDDAHATPYLYVTHWADTSDHRYWNASAFAGASLSYARLADSRDPVSAARNFFDEGRTLLEGT